jgi:hypothetical protein
MWWRNLERLQLLSQQPTRGTETGLTVQVYSRQPKYKRWGHSRCEGREGVSAHNKGWGQTDEVGGRLTGWGQTDEVGGRLTRLGAD